MKNKNKLCSLMHDDFDHVILAMANNTAKGMSSKSKKTFMLEGNIETLFVKALDAGKLTIRFKSPACSLYIQPSSEQLRVDADAGKAAEPLKQFRGSRFAAVERFPG